MVRNLCHNFPGIFLLSKIPIVPLRPPTLLKIQFRNLRAANFEGSSVNAKGEVSEQGDIPLEIDKEEVSSQTFADESVEENYNESDDNFFKALRKTSTKHWLENAKEVVNRIDWKKLLNQSYVTSFKEDLKRRQSEVDIDKIVNLWNKLQNMKDTGQAKEINDLKKEIASQAVFIPNSSHPESLKCADEEPSVIYTHGEPRNPKGLKQFHEYCEKRDYLRGSNLGNLTLSRSYILLGPLAELAQALTRFSADGVKAAGFKIISVPDIINPHVIEACGFPTRGLRNQVFWLDNPKDSDEPMCLSGTAEMGISSLLENKVFAEEDLPIKLAAVTRCYRAETSSMEEEKGIYRVHTFTKVEMFGITANETGTESNELHMQFKQIQENLFSSLGLHFRTLEMPPVELGTSAHRKFDIEAWMPARNMFGEISSCSNCTDFQSRRLNIRYLPSNSTDLKYVHTVNGTACAIPRMLITMIETFQTKDTVNLPSALNPFLIRSWDESAAATPTYRSTFLRTKAQQDKATQNYREW